MRDIVRTTELFVVEPRIFTEPQQEASYDDLLRAARTAEDAGYGAFFRSDHYLKMGSVDGLPGPTDPWITFAGLARDTSTIRLGTLMTAATFRYPGPLAISVAQVDQMSGGRVEFGIGAGWYEAEHIAYGIPFPTLGARFERYEEQLAIITGLWETPVDGTFSFEGKHYNLTDAPALSKPAQDRIPVVIGGMGARRTPALAASYATEFNLRSWASTPPSSSTPVSTPRAPKSAATPARCPSSRRTASAEPRPRLSTASARGASRPASSASTCRCWTCPTSTTSSRSLPTWLRSCPDIPYISKAHISYPIYRTSDMGYVPVTLAQASARRTSSGIGMAYRPNRRRYPMYRSCSAGSSR
ncbi:F420-dependent oxidoreductase-like protein [Lentzea atacamensis]|uniref:F420-dependent oxidoreductase-like protein n=1 Tax=Lentzea atacamensis TaxID=531938 RepID=A0ABX9E2S7_9PSEU|nr:F420-dependent oxidoreductase-like protein [Lentzea atacamensis]